MEDPAMDDDPDRDDPATIPPPVPPAPPVPPTPPAPPQAASAAISPAAQALSISQDEKNLGIIMHVLGLAGLAILGPLIIWLIKKDTSPYLDAQGRELLNFQLSYFLYGLCCVPLMYVCIGVPLFFGVIIATLILTIFGLVQAVEGKIYRYPATIRFL